MQFATAQMKKTCFNPVDKNGVLVYNDTVSNRAGRKTDPAERKLTMDEKELQSEIYTLTDEEGNELQFEVIASAEVNGITYYAMIPVDDQPEAEDVYEYVVLKAEKDENGEDILVTIDDDDEFDNIADYFDDMLSDEADYDVNNDDEE